MKLARLDAWNARREAVARLYRERLQGIPGLGLPRSCGHAPSVHHLFVVDHPERDRLQAGLKAAGVETLIHYPVPPHRSGAYAAGGFAEGAFPVTDAACRSHLSLPIGPHLKTEDAELVVEAVAAVVRPLIP